MSVQLYNQELNYAQFHGGPSLEEEQGHSSHPDYSPFGNLDGAQVGCQFPKTNSAQKRFCNMFTTQKFCEWLRHEWLYSTTDREIFLGCNDFQIILREQFPTLKTRNLLRGQWAIIRRIIGKPRRFSATFLAEERGSVHGKRRNLHYLQQVTLTGSLGPMASEHLDTLLTCLPATTRIPPRLPVGTRVCIRTCTPVQGLFLGVIQDACPGDGHYAVWIEDLILSNNFIDCPPDSVDQSGITYRGFRIVPDEDVFPLPNQSLPQSIPLSAIRYHFKENLFSNVEHSSAPGLRMVGLFTNSRLVDTTNMRTDYDATPLSSSGGPLLSDSVCTTECPIEPNGHSSIVTDNLLVSSLKQDSNAAPTCSFDLPVPHSVDPQSNMKLFASLVSFYRTPGCIFSHSQAKLYKLLDDKRVSVAKLKVMNDTAEIKLSENHNNITVQFQHSYATLILYLDKLNQELKHHMDVVLMHVAKMPIPATPYLLSTCDGQVYEAVSIAQDQNMMHLNYLTDWRRRCDDEAQEMVSRIKMAQRRVNLDDCKVDLVAKLSCLLIHLCVSSTFLLSTFRLIPYLQNLSDQRIIGQTLACIEDLLKEIREYLHPSNVQCFELTVEHFIGQIIHAVTSAYHSCFQPCYPFMAQSQPPAPSQMTYPDNMTCM
ncbi:hypothetical protein EG68_12246 [Paragonimus skrjabini miyazakii]|uniref:DIRP domain-containing protein n=1 Tax=Paragonimus skrjabini miyazakii TaxID=59628 RepID=A0A8S9Y8N0_9TREM|nr:hypothetical protein EG68_12246 [Paragonimus skrjabini miyazakii]